MCDKIYLNCLNTFAFDLFRILCNDSKQNELFSPFSVLTALNMTLLGAKNNTEKELFDGLRYNLGFSSNEEVHGFVSKIIESWHSEDLPFTLDVANRVLVEKVDTQKVNEDYGNKLNLLYKAVIDEVDFVNDADDILKSCNDWVINVTKGKIPTILEKIDPNTVAILLNAIYFKGSWIDAFDEKLTKIEPFFNFGDTGNAKDIQLMFKRKVNARLHSETIDGEELRLLELPYKGNVTMNILMTTSLNGLQKIERSINYETVNNLPIIASKVDSLWLPKFKVETKYELVDYLKQLGINDAFSEKADFSGIDNKTGRPISKVCHKAVIEVNEEGSVAAAATAVVRNKYCARIEVEPPLEFRVDHPFIYFLKDTNTGVILFVGKVDEL